MPHLLTDTAAFFLYWAYRLYAWTVRKEVVNASWDPRHSNGQNAIFVFWHAKTMLLLPACQNLPIGILTLCDWKNRLYDRICQRFGYHTTAAASPALAIISLRSFLENGYHIALALDGPSGPAGSMKPGAFNLAMSTGRPIVAVNATSNRSLRLGFRWDRFEVPFLFSRATAVLSEPVFVTEKTLDEAKEKIKRHLENI